MADLRYLLCFRSTVASKAKDAGSRVAALAANQAAVDTAGKWDLSTRAGMSYSSVAVLFEA